MTTDRDQRLVELVSPAGELTARFAPQAGMVGCSLRHREEELLGLRGGLEAYLDRGSTFGIPLLYPWANRLGAWSYEVGGRHVELRHDSPRLRSDEHGLPIHGALAGVSSWQVVDAGPSRLVAELDFGAHRDLLAVFPFPHVLGLDVRLEDAGLEVTTTVSAGPDAAVPLSFGFHPYLAPPGSERADWWIELPSRTALELDERGLPTGRAGGCVAEGCALGARTYDDLFAVGPGSRLSVATPDVRLTVELVSGYRYAQVFAPRGQPLICFEPMMAPVDALRSHEGLRSVAPGERATATFAIRVDTP